MDCEEQCAQWSLYFATNPLPFALFKLTGPAGAGQKATLCYGNPALAKLLDLTPAGLQNVSFTAAATPTHLPCLFRVDTNAIHQPAATEKLNLSQEELIAVAGEIAQGGGTRNLLLFCSQRQKYVRATLYQQAPGLCACFLLDITGEIKDRLRLEEQQSEINALLAAFPGGLFKYEATRGGKFTFIGEQMLKTLGYTEAEFRTKFNNCFDDMVYVEDREKVLQSIEDQIKNSDFDTCEYRVETKSGALKWFYDVGHLVKDPQGKRWFYVVIVDIDDRKRLEVEREQKEKLQAALLASESSNRAKSMFLSNVSHDMRTPLNGVIGYTELALVTQDQPRMLDYLRKIKDSSRILLDLIQDTLDLSTIETGSYVLHKQPVSCAEVVRGIVTAVEPAARDKNITFTVDNSKAIMADIDIDIHRVQEILLNLLNNAVKFTAPGGKVELIIECVGATETVVHDKLMVRDTGCGISKEFLPRIFEPFAQEHNWNASGANMGGTGLGLSIVKRLVELMGGRIEVQSEPGQGSTFTVYLDFERVQNYAKPQEQPQPDLAKLRGKRILLCEDHPLNADIAVKLLERQGMQVTVAQNGQIGVTIFQKSTPGFFHIILMDVRMPVLDGLAATKAIRALARPDARTVPILGMSANAYDEDYRQAWDAGMNDYVAKPVLPDVLYKTLAKWVK
jgi:PAS domain S-box-containing protein